MIGFGLWAMPLKLNAQATEGLDYVPFAGFRLGTSFTGDNFYQPKTGCVVGKASTLPRNATSLSVRIVSNDADLDQSLGVDQHISAGFFGLAKAHEAFGLKDRVRLSSTDAAVVFSATAETDGETFEAPIQYTPEIERLINLSLLTPMEIKHIRDLCGDRFIRSVLYERRVYVISVIHNSARYVNNTLHIGVGGGVDVSVGSVDADLNIDTNYNSAKSSKDVSVYAFTEGAGGFAPAATLFDIPGSAQPSDILKALKSFLASASSGPGQPVRYELERVPHLDVSPLFQDAVVSSARSLVEAYFAANEDRQDVVSLLDPQSGDPRQDMLTDTAKLDAKRYVDLLDANLKKIATAHFNCTNAGNFCDAPPAEPVRPADVPPPIPAGPGRVSTRLYVESPSAGNKLLPFSDTLVAEQINGPLLLKARRLIGDASSATLVEVVNNPFVVSAYVEEAWDSGRTVDGPVMVIANARKDWRFAPFLHTDETALALMEDHAGSADMRCGIPSISSLRGALLGIVTPGDVPSGIRTQFATLLLQLTDAFGRTNAVPIGIRVMTSGVDTIPSQPGSLLKIDPVENSVDRLPSYGTLGFYAFSLFDASPGYHIAPIFIAARTGSC